MNGGHLSSGPSDERGLLLSGGVLEMKTNAPHARVHLNQETCYILNFRLFEITVNSKVLRDAM
jgi:hypothetical protein